MWYIESGELKGTSLKEDLPEAFIDLMKTVYNETNQWPVLSIIVVASKEGFDYEAYDDDKVLFALTPPLLKKYNSILVEHEKVPDDSILNAKIIGAPDEDEWDDYVFEVNEDTQIH